MSREMVVYKGTKVFFHSMIYKDAIKSQEEWCALCNKKIYKGDTIHLIMNNQSLFPNVYVHEACIESKESCIEQLIENYKDFENSIHKYRFWLDRMWG